MKKLLSAALCLVILSAAFTSCGKGKSATLFTGDADFVLTLEREDGEGTLTMEVIRRGDVTEARITSPAELEGVTFSRSPGSSVISSDSVSVPMTEDAARGADLVFDVLSDPLPDTATAEKKDDGTEYIFSKDGAEISLVVDGEGTPKRAVITFDDMKRTVEIDGFVKK